MAVPIWKDKFVSLGTDSSMQFRIVLTDTSEVIYTGKAYKKPGETNNTIRINDICADYFTNVLPTLSQAQFTSLTLPLSFKVQKYVSSAWTDVETVQFLNDWSYDFSYNAATMGLSFPINGRIDSRQPLVWTGLSVSSVTATVYYKDGTTSQVIIPVAISADFNADFNADFAKSVRTAGSGTAVFLPSTWSNLAKVVVSNSTFTVVTSCAKYALYYVNAYGGWDTLLIEGNTIQADSLTRHQREVIYDNSNVQNRGIDNYVNEISKGFTFYTGWLTDTQSAKMHHLLNSTDVFMWDFSTSQMIPVVLTDTQTDYKTFKSNGNQMVNYTINVNVAHNRIRR